MKTEELDGTTYHYPETAADVTDAMLKLAEDVFDDWFADEERIDWEEFLDRMATYSRHEDVAWEFDEYNNPAIDKIKRHIREYRNL